MRRAELRTTAWRLTLGFAVAIVCLVALGLVAITEAGQMGRAADTIVTDAQPINQAAHDLLLQLVNEETGVRAYVATGRATFLQPYTAGQRAVARDLAFLTAHFRGHSAIQGLIERAARPQIMALHGYFAHLLALVRQGRHSVALAQLGAGKEEMDSVRAAMAAVLAESDNVMRAAHDASQTSGATMVRTVLAATAGTVLLTLLSGAALARSLTRRLWAEEARRQDLARFRALIERASDMVTIVDAQGTPRYVSPSAERLLGFSQTQIQQQNAFTYLHPDDLPRVQAAFAEALRTPGVPAVVRARYQHADGSWRWLESLGTNALADPAIGGIIVNSRDITERVQAEEALRAREERYRALSEQASDLISIVDAGGTIRYASPSYEELLGYPPADLEGRSILTLVHPDDLPTARRGFDGRVTNAGAPQAIELRVRHAEGSWRSVEVIGNNRLADPAVGGIILTGRDISARAEATAALRRQALHDALTDLPNRVLLHDRVEQALQVARREHGHMALLLLDLDRFKEVNDTFGHHMGDIFLQEVARRLQGGLRATDTVARLGGDEFAVLLTHVDREAAVAVVEKIKAALEAPIPVGAHAVHVEGSLGIALGPEHGEDTATLLRHADVAMYLAKDAGQDYAVYDPEQDAYTPDRLTLIGELRQAIAEGALELHYQPKATLATRQVMGVEALVRWRHPTRGLVRPDQFIPLAEQTGLIGPLTLWVLEEALRQCQAWGRQDHQPGVAVNLSTRNLQDPQLADTVAALLQRYAVEPGRLTLEITESALMADPVRAQTMLLRLVELGVRMAIDDFGTGYSSLAYLKHLPVDEVKIDQSFVRGMGLTGLKNTAIVRSVIDLGHNLGLTVVAEGVEDQEAWNLLRAARCDMAQGYYLSRPLPAAELERWLEVSAWGATERSPL